TGSPSKRRREERSHEGYLDLTKQTPSRTVLVEYDRLNDPAYVKELQDRLGPFGSAAGLAASVTRPELTRALQHAQHVRETSTTTTTHVETLEEILRRFREDERLAREREREDERKHFDNQMEILHQQLEKEAADREKSRARGQGLDLTEFADRQAAAARQDRLDAAAEFAEQARQEALTKMQQESAASQATPAEKTRARRDRQGTLDVISSDAYQQYLDAHPETPPTLPAAGANAITPMRPTGSDSRTLTQASSSASPATPQQTQLTSRSERLKAADEAGRRARWETFNDGLEQEIETLAELSGLAPEVKAALLKRRDAHRRELDETEQRAREQYLQAHPIETTHPLAAQ
ncbi:MAG: M protein repeat protein, partial [Rhodospirillaceae bacterium]